MSTPEIQHPQSNIHIWAGLAVSAVALGAYLFTLSPTVNFLDSGELITVGATAGVAHPPGYPLYTLLVILAAAIPLGDVAVRVNLVSALGGALAVGLFYTLIYEILAHHLHTASAARRPAVPPAAQRPGRRAAQRGDTPAPAPTTPKSKIQNPKSKISQPPTPNPQPPTLLPIAVAAGTALLLAASLTFWNWATQAKMYTLHFAFVAGLIWGALRVRRAWRGAGGPGALWPPGAWPPAARALLLLALATGLTFTNHFMSVWLLPGLAVLLFWPGHPGAGDTVPRPERDAPPWRWFVRYAPWLLVAGLAPLLLYLYLPLRAAADPLMNWGSPDSWGDFWRHVTVWQFRVYIGQQDTMGKFLSDAVIFAAEQLGTGLGAIVLALAVGGLVRLARRNLALLIATALIAVLTFIYTLNYQIREVIVYYVPMYMMIILWAGVGLDWLLRAVAARLAAATTPSPPPQSAIRNPQSAILALLPLLLGVLALGWNLGRAGHRDDVLAEAYAHNQFQTFAPNAVVLTDNWDLVSPSYYLQYVRGERPDLIIIDKGLTRYPFYLDYMDRQFAPVMDLVRDEEARYRQEERRWVNGEPYDPQIGQYYVDFLRAILTRSQAAGRPVYIQWADLAHLDAEAQQITSGLQVHPEGLAFRVDAEPFTAAPPDPQFDWRGILTNPVPKDEVAHSVIDAYPAAFDRLAAFARSTNHPTEAQRFTEQAAQVRAALGLPTR
jgi:hypothetical protein